MASHKCPYWVKVTSGTTSSCRYVFEGIFLTIKNYGFPKTWENWSGGCLTFLKCGPCGDNLHLERRRILSIHPRGLCMSPFSLHGNKSISWRTSRSRGNFHLKKSSSKMYGLKILEGLVFKIIYNTYTNFATWNFTLKYLHFVT